MDVPNSAPSKVGDVGKILQGYTELTHISEESIERIAEHHFSPVNVIVHATEPRLRASIMNDDKGAKLGKYLARLKSARITMNFLVALRKGINDGRQLERTISDLCEYIPFGRSLAVVLAPSGYSNSDDNYTKEDATKILQQVSRWNNVLFEKYGTAFVFAGDELYLKAGQNLPPYDYYEGFPQIDNGVGAMATFKEEFCCALDDFAGEDAPPGPWKRVTLVIREEGHEFIRELVQQAAPRLGLDIIMVCVCNTLFGSYRGFGGIISGEAILQCLTEGAQDLGTAVLLPASMLRGEAFLDGISLTQLQLKLGIPVHATSINGVALCHALKHYASL